MESTKYKQFPIGWAMMEDISEDASDGWTQSYNDMQLAPQHEVDNLGTDLRVPEALESEVICIHTLLKFKSSW